ncbi:MAG: hypothetical protein Q9195_005128 [Heterodermia aff. obscurata]
MVDVYGSKSQEPNESMACFCGIGALLLGELQRQTDLLNKRRMFTQDTNTGHRRFEDHMDRFFDETDDITRVYEVLGQILELATTTLTMQEAEKALEKFWQHLDEHSVSTCGKCLNQLFDFEFEERKLARTPDWSDAETPRPAPKRKSIAEASLQDALAAKLHLERHNEQTKSQETVVTPKEKVKTRGTPGVQPPQVPDISHEADMTQKEPKIAVSKRAMKTFSTLFFDDSHEAPPGELPWTEFLHAMASAGFSSQKLNGSAWIFEPTNDMLRRSIIFHEPHPIPKIRYITARGLGRRLNRAYGWTLETFERVRKENNGE